VQLCEFYLSEESRLLLAIAGHEKKIAAHQANRPGAGVPLLLGHVRRRLRKQLGAVQVAQKAHHVRDVSLRALVHSVSGRARVILQRVEKDGRKGTPEDEAQVRRWGLLCGLRVRPWQR